MNKDTIITIAIGVIALLIIILLMVLILNQIKLDIPLDVANITALS